MGSASDDINKPDVVPPSVEHTSLATTHGSTLLRRVFQNSDGPRYATDWLATIGAVAIICFISLPPITSLPPWIDETYTVAAVENLSESLSSTHFTMSGYYVVLWLWSAVSTSIVWLRMFSLFCAIGTILCLRKLAVLIGGRSLAATAVIILPFLAMFQWKAWEARSYSLEILVVCACWLIVVSGKLYGSRQAWRWWLVLGLLGVFGESLHGLFFLQYLPIATYLVLVDRRFTSMIRALGLLAVPVVVAGLLWLDGASGVGTYMGGGPKAWIGSYIHTFFGDNAALVMFLFGGSVVWLALLIRSAASDRTGTTATFRWIGPLWTFLPMAGMTILSLTVNVFNPRYLAPILPGLALLLAQVAESLSHLIKRATGERAAEFTATQRNIFRSSGFIAIVSLVILGSIATPKFVDSPLRQIVSKVAADTGPPLLHYLRGDI